MSIASSSKSEKIRMYLSNETFEQKSSKYAELVAQVKQNGWHAEVLPVEVGCRGFVAKSTTSLLTKMRVTGNKFRKAVRTRSQAAEHSSNWIWIKRKQSGRPKRAQKGV